MDPLSISATCLAVATTIVNVSSQVTRFVRDVREARSDLDAVTRELLSLKNALELIAEDLSNTDDPLPETLNQQVGSVVSNCSTVVTGIEKALGKHKGNKARKAMHWISSGRDEVTKLRLSLEAHKTSLEITLDMVAW